MRQRRTLAVALVALAVGVLALFLRPHENANPNPAVEPNLPQKVTSGEQVTGPSLVAQPPITSSPPVFRTEPVPRAALADMGKIDTAFKLLAECRREHWCPTGTECARTAAGELGCYASNCKRLGDRESCARDDACIEIIEGFFRCAPSGFLAEGEECLDRQSANASRRCGPGLLCIAGRCSSECTTSKGCGSALLECLQTPHGNFCVASNSLCDKEHPCHPGEACLQDERAGTMVCITPVALPSGQPGCTPSSCPQGQVCAGARWGGHFYGRCLVECATTPCADGYCAPANLQTVTGPMVCHPSCVPPGTECGSDGQCVFNPKNGVGLCAVSMPYDNTINSLEEWDSVFPPTPDALPSRK